MTRGTVVARRAVSAGVAVLIGAGTLMTGVAASTSPVVDDAYGGSAATKQGTGRFEDLTVTVDKTTNLSNESVDVSWQWTGDDPGSRATPGTGYPYNFMQVFQCWGDGTEGADGPPREQCQFGGNWAPSSDYFNLTPQSGQWFDTGYLVSRTVSRAVNQRPDPLEEVEGAPYRYDAAVENSGVVPMRAAPVALGDVPRQVTSPITNVYFDRALTNEVSVAQTSAAGSGSTSIELHTRFESSFVGCGDRVEIDREGEAVVRPCYLVVVPRDNVEVNGARLPALGQFRAGAMLGSSPLSLSNWQNRIVFPLDFLPLREPCQLGAVERSIVGQEALSTAFLAWQSKLCSNGLPLFYASVVDDIARSSAIGNRPLLQVVTDPVPPGSAPTADDLVYAPVGVSGLTVAFFIERQYNSTTRPAELQSYDGSRATQLNLTPRLVAKLLTQSYGASVFSNGAPDYLLGDDIPASLVRDPEFRAANTPADREIDLLTDIANVSGSDKEFSTLLLPFTSSDAVRGLWTWILADDDAAAFLDGKPDEYGMTVNPNHRGLERYVGADGRPRVNIERFDQPCKTVGVGAASGEEGPICNGDANPTTQTFGETARLASRGQPLGSESLEKNATTGAIRVSRPSPQFPGQRTMLALTTTASAARLGLSTASLQNASGDFVAPTVASMTAAVSLAEPTGVRGVKRIDPAEVVGDAYPLTSFSYAVTNPALLDTGARNDYAAVIDYAATDGQVQGIRPGDLPPGYAPLPEADRDLAVSNAAAIRNYRAPAATTPTPSPTATTAATTAAAAAGTTSQSTDSGFAVPAPFRAVPQPTAAAPLPAASPLPVLGPPLPDAVPPAARPVALARTSATTQATDVALRLILPVFLALGVVAALMGGGFVLFGKGGVLAPGRPATPQSSPPQSPPPQSPPPPG